MTHRSEYSVDRLRTRRTIYKPLPVPMPMYEPQPQTVNEDRALQLELLPALNDRARKECAQ